MKAIQKGLEDYLSLPYRMEITPDIDEGGFVVSFPDLPGCLSVGNTVDEAVANAEDAKKEWIAAAIENGYPVNEPDSVLKNTFRQGLKLISDDFLSDGRPGELPTDRVD